MNAVMSATRAREDHARPVVLITEDDENMRGLIASVLEPLGEHADVVCVHDGEEALGVLERGEVGVVVTDLRMPGRGGLDVLSAAKARDPLIQVVLITGYATVDSAIEAFKNGVFDYLRKPFENVELRCTVERALEHHLLGRENRRLRARSRIYEEGGLIGQSQAMARVEEIIAAAADYDCSVLISGESGSGKEVVARQIHTNSPRRERPFVAINCAAIPEHLIESELFGYRKGAFTGADRNKPGLFDVANGGTLFLDEINNATLSLQAKLLRVLEDGSFYPMGETEPHYVDVRVLAASNRPITDMIGSGHFREDLYYRLMVMEVALPPLRERREDIPLLAYFFVNKFAGQYRKQVSGLTTEVLALLMRYDWPGNVRELEHMVQRMVILCETGKIGVELLPPRITGPKGEVQGGAQVPLQSLEELETWFIRKILGETQGDRGLAAEILGIDKSTLWRKIKRYQLDA
jgi:DNA-binding NtrC family response regulator